MGRAFEYRKARKLKRWGNMARVFTRLGKEITIAPMCHLWKIPVEEFNYNKALDEAKDQNPGYAN